MQQFEHVYPCAQRGTCAILLVLVENFDVSPLLQIGMLTTPIIVLKTC